MCVHVLAYAQEHHKIEQARRKLAPTFTAQTARVVACWRPPLTNATASQLWPRCTSRKGKREARRCGEPQLWPSAGVHAQARLETRLQALQEERNRNAAPSV